MYQHKKVTKKVYDNLIKSSIKIQSRKYDCDKRPLQFLFHFDCPKDFDENLEHEIEFIIKSNGCLAENKIKKEIEQLFSKYKHGNDILEHRKQENEWTT